MPTRDTAWPAGTPCWADLAVPDLPKAVEFYSGVLGWSLVDTGEEYGHYHFAQVNGYTAAGVGPRPMSLSSRSARRRTPAERPVSSTSRFPWRAIAGNSSGCRITRR